MARARNIKPSFFTNEKLVELPYEARLMFIGLWTLADRKGRLEDRPKRIKMALFPADDVNPDGLLSMLAKADFIMRYEVEGNKYIQVLNFTKHQNPHVNERPSTIPAPEGHESDPADSLIPDSPIPVKTNGAFAPTEYSPEFELAWCLYPPRQGDNPKKQAFQCWNARLKDGHSVDELRSGVERYVAYCEATGKGNTEFVMQAKRFFGSNKPFMNTWKVNGATHAPHQRTDNSAIARVRAANGIKR